MDAPRVAARIAVGWRELDDGETSRSRAPMSGRGKRRIGLGPHLVVLQLVELTTVMLAATHPEVGHDGPTRPLDLQAIRAEQIIQIGAYLVEATSRYRDASIAGLHASDSLPS